MISRILSTTDATRTSGKNATSANSSTPNDNPNATLLDKMPDYDVHFVAHWKPASENAQYTVNIWVQKADLPKPDDPTNIENYTLIAHQTEVPDISAKDDVVIGVYDEVPIYDKLINDIKQGTTVVPGLAAFMNSDRFVNFEAPTKGRNTSSCTSSPNIRSNACSTCSRTFGYGCRHDNSCCTCT